MSYTLANCFLFNRLVKEMTYFDDSAPAPGTSVPAVVYYDPRCLRSLPELPVLGKLGKFIR